MNINLKKIAAAAGLGVIFTAFSVAPINAAEGDGGSSGADSSSVTNGILQQIAGSSGMSSDLLRQIANNTQQTLAKVNAFPTYVEKMIEFTLNMQKSDTSAETAAMQEQFALTGKGIADNANAQNAGVVELDRKLLGSNVKDIPNARSLFYSSLLGYNVDIPGEVPTDPTKPTDPALDFIKNASGYTIRHKAPSGTWSGDRDSIARYMAYYYTVIPAQSYGAYILSNQYAETKTNKNGLTNAQMSLVAKASDSGWLSKIATEEIGVVLRQILMFESQNYVLNTQLLQTQKQLLTAQVMTNGILIAGFQADEKKLVDDALFRKV